MKAKLLLFLSFALISSPLSAVVLVDNLSATTAGSGSTIVSTQWQAQGFTTDATSYFLDSVVLNLKFSGSGDLVGFLYSGTSTTPVSELGSFIDSGATTSSFSDVTFNANGSIVLAANTSYWLVFGTETTGTYQWSFAASGQGGSTDGPGSILNRFATSSDQGASWPSIGSTSSPNLIQVNVTAVPEPATYGVIFGMLALGLVAFIRRRSAKT